MAGFMPGTGAVEQARLRAQGPWHGPGCFADSLILGYKVEGLVSGNGNGSGFLVMRRGSDTGKVQVQEHRFLTKAELEAAAARAEVRERGLAARVADPVLVACERKGGVMNRMVAELVKVAKELVAEGVKRDISRAEISSLLGGRRFKLRKVSFRGFGYGEAVAISVEGLPSGSGGMPASVYEANKEVFQALVELKKNYTVEGLTIV